MTETVLYHHVQGLTDGVRSFADELRQAGHTVHTPDLFGGRTFATIEEGLAFARDTGFEALADLGVAAANGIGPDAVYAGFSFGVMPAQQLAQTRAGARGALLMYSCLPVSEFGEAWPEGVPVQVHGKEADERRLHIEWRQLANQVVNDPDIVAAKRSAGSARTDLEKRQRLRDYYELYYGRMRMLARSAEMKTALDQLKTAHLSQLTQAKVRHESDEALPTPSPTPKKKQKNKRASKFRPGES